MYTITEEDINTIDKKIEFQKEFLKNFVLESNEKQFNLLDNCYHANLNPTKYFSEINNRVNSLNSYAKSKNLKPVFITITLPSRYHKKTLNNDLIISPKYSTNKLSEMWKKFQDLKIFKNMKKKGYEKLYFKVFEPHKSGVPHLHILLYLPVSYIIPIKKRFYDYFKKENDFVRVEFKYTFYKDKGGAIAYLLKYINKTFSNPNKRDLTFYWYVKFRIIRFTSSRTLAPLYLYRKIRYYFKKKYKSDYLHITKLYFKKVIKVLFDKGLIQFIYFDEVLEDIQELNLYVKRIIPELIKPKFKTQIKLNYKKKLDLFKPIPIVIDGLEYLSSNHQIFKKEDFYNNKNTISNISDHDLEKYYYNFDFENENLHKLGVIKKELIKRKILPYENLNLNDFNDSFSF